MTLIFCMNVCSSLVAHLAIVAATRVPIPASCPILYIKYKNTHYGVRAPGNKKSKKILNFAGRRKPHTWAAGPRRPHTWTAGPRGPNSKAAGPKRPTTRPGHRSSDEAHQPQDIRKHQPRVETHHLPDFYIKCLCPPTYV